MFKQSIIAVSSVFLIVLLTFLSGPVLAAPAEPAQDVESNHFEFTYRVELDVAPDEASSLQVFVPLAASSEFQTINSWKVESNLGWVMESEKRYGNQTIRAFNSDSKVSDSENIENSYYVNVTYDVVRNASSDAQSSAKKAKKPAKNLSYLEKLRYKKFLRANERVVVGHEILDPILAEIEAELETDDLESRARATYDWVVNNVTYKKVGTGWGNGDTFWACNERYGNCTDFHSLFISLARTQGIPAKFLMGFPLPEDRKAGEIKGYHCWVEFYLPGRGWIAIDASEAAKHPEKVDSYYAQQKSDRIHFSTGRDLSLGAFHKDRALNYFIYPHIESGGKKWKGKAKQSFTYRKH